MTAQGDLFEDRLPSSRSLLPSAEASSDGFCLTPPPVPPKISPVAVGKLRPHPAVRALGYDPPATELEPVRQHWKTAVSEPLIATFNGIIIDGHKRWIIAQERKIKMLPCVRLPISEDEALDLILARASAKNSWSRYRRICLALTREEALHERARENQRAGGRKKVPSTLTKAHPIEVRREIARMTGAGSGSVTKVKRILNEGSLWLKKEAWRGAISIDAAWKISKLRPDEQARELGRRASKRRASKRVLALGRAAAMRNGLVSQHLKEQFKQVQNLLDELTRFAQLEKFRESSIELLACMERELNVDQLDPAKT